MSNQAEQIVITGKYLKIARIQEEWYKDVEDPYALIEDVKKVGRPIDIFTFWQRLGDTRPRFPFHTEQESIAALPIQTYEHWLGKQVDSNTKRAVKRATKAGIIVRESDFDKDFIEGMTKVFNETPIRQGRPFLHYGKDYETIKRDFSRYLFREDLVGAYLKEDLVGFIMLAYAGEYALLGQIISMVMHRDKSINNALIAKAVEVCEKKKISYLIYWSWGRGSLQEFKRRNGFEKIDLPRYYIPLTLKGKIALKLGFHQRLPERIPENIFQKLVDIRSRWYSFRFGDGTKPFPFPIAKGNSR
jgi:hypothetical protein